MLFKVYELDYQVEFYFSHYSVVFNKSLIGITTVSFLKTLKLFQFPERENRFTFFLLSKGNKVFHAWDP